MALFKILKGQEKNLPANKTEGWAYVTTDEGNMYVDVSASKRVRIGAHADKADVATKAEGDTKSIREIYLAKLKQVTSDGTQFTFRGETGNGTNAPDLISIPLAGDKAGLISNAAQTIKGEKTFANGIKFPDVTSTTYPAKSVGLTWAGSTDGAKIYYEVQALDKGMLIIEATDDTNAGTIFRNSNSGKTVSIINGVVTGDFTGNLTGTANNAISDNAGKKITSYVQSVTKKGPAVFTITKGDGTTNDIALDFLPTAGGTIHGELYADSITAGSLVVNGVARFVNGLLGDLTGNVKGNVTGNLTGTASRATSDTNGKNITSYVASVLAQSDNRTIQVTKGDGTTNNVKLYFAASSSFGGAADSANILNGHVEQNVTTNSGTGKIRYSYTIYKDTTGLFASTDNSNGILTISRHNGNYYSQLGFSSNGKLYYRSFSDVALNTTMPWKQIAFTDSTIAKATQAEKDWIGQVIDKTYIKYPLSISGEVITMIRGDGTSSTITVPDTNVTQSETTTSNYRPIILGDISSTDTTKLSTSTRNQVHTSNKFYAQPSTGLLVATTFKGALDGNAKTATDATYAEKAKGDTTSIRTTYIHKIKQVTSNGTTFTFRGEYGDGSNANDLITIPAASSSIAGLVTTGAQTIAGNKTFTGQIIKNGVSTTFVQGRNNALLRMSSIYGYSPAISIKTTNGSWDIGAYNAYPYTDDLIFTYITDANYNANDNNTRTQIKFLENGHIVASLDGNASSATKLATARTIRTNLASTSEASFDGTANITPGVTGTLPTGNGGTGVTSHTANRLVWSTSATTIQAGYHYATTDRVAINYTSAPSYNFYVNGSSYFSGNANVCKVYNSQNYNNDSSLTVTQLAAHNNASCGMIYAVTDNPRGAAGWVHVWSQAWNNGDTGSWVSQIALNTQDGAGMWYRTTSGNIAGRAWIRVLDSSNYTSYTVTKTGSGASGTWGISITGNAATATKLATARTIWGQSFNGTANISGNMTGVGNINTAAAPAGTIYMNNWFRSTGNTGWYNETYGGGWYMTDSTYIRNYASKSVRLDNLCLGADNNSYRLYVNGKSYFNSTGNSTYSKDGNASIITTGGVSVAGRVSANSIKIDNADSGANTEGCIMKYNSTYKCVEFIFGI